MVLTGRRRVEPDAEMEGMDRLELRIGALIPITVRLRRGSHTRSHCEGLLVRARNEGLGHRAVAADVQVRHIPG